jgi:hypothetical protein
MNGNAGRPRPIVDRICRIADVDEQFSDGAELWFGEGSGALWFHDLLRNPPVAASGSSDEDEHHRAESESTDVPLRPSFWRRLFRRVG